jgi:hypothetical protein
MLDNLALGILKLFFLIPALICQALSRVVTDPDWVYKLEKMSVGFWMGFDQPDVVMGEDELKSNLLQIKALVVITLTLVLTSVLNKVFLGR